MLSAFTLAMISISEVKRIGKELRINEQIRAREVRVVSDANEQLGIMTLHEAIRMAEEKGLDLVEVAPNGRPPVCRIMNYGKYRYEQQKRDKEAKKKQKVFQIKEVKLRPNIEDHDFFVKLKNAQRFLGDGNKVIGTMDKDGTVYSSNGEIIGRLAPQGDMKVVTRKAVLDKDGNVIGYVDENGIAKDFNGNINKSIGKAIREREKAYEK